MKRYDEPRIPRARGMKLIIHERKIAVHSRHPGRITKSELLVNSSENTGLQRVTSAVTSVLRERVRDITHLNRWKIPAAVRRVPSVPFPDPGPKSTAN